MRKEGQRVICKGRCVRGASQNDTNKMARKERSNNKQDVDTEVSKVEWQNFEENQ